MSILAALAIGLGACASAEGGGGGGADAANGDAISLPDGGGGGGDGNQTSYDANASCPTGCTLVAPQCGCAPGQACDLDSTMLSTGGTECRDVTTAGMDTDSCTSSDPETCAAGYICAGGGSSYHCRKYCANDTDCPGDGAFCLINITYSGGMPIPGATTCTKDCDPIASANPTGCPTGYGCHVFVDDPNGSLPTTDGDEYALTDCTAAGAGTDGTTCTSSVDCAPGFDCINSGGTTACRQNCIRPSGTCGTGTCSPLTPAAIVGGVEYGVCI